MEQGKILVIGAGGQIGVELVVTLRKRYGKANVIAADIRPIGQYNPDDGPFELLNVLNDEQLKEIIERHGITDVYHLAAMLSAKAESNPGVAWDLNMNSLFNILELAREKVIKKIFWPSSIAVFGTTTPKNNTSQFALCEPNTVYGISKLAGERWCQYYFDNYGVDVRSIRYPGLIGYKSLPGGGTTDYAIDIFHKACGGETFECFLEADERLPMMYMQEAIDATIGIMEADASTIKIRGSYNLAGIDFTPAELARSIQSHVPDFDIVYKPDFRQGIASTWPNSIDDSDARNDWGWNPSSNISSLTEIMLNGIRKKNAELETF
jgi:nucleoside-diphosphate-sugar epimerase